MATQPVFDSTTEIETEPDNDSDDGPFQPSAQPPANQDIVTPPNGSDPVALDHNLTPSNDASEGQQIAQLIANDDGVSKSYVVYADADGSMTLDMADANDNQTHEVVINGDGSSDDVTYGSNGSISSTSVSQQGSEAGLPVSDTSVYDKNGNQLGLILNNEDGTQTQLACTMNSDGSESLGQIAEFKNGQEVAPEAPKSESNSDLLTLAKDTFDWALDKSGEWLEGTGNKVLQAIGEEMPAISKIWQVGNVIYNDLNLLGPVRA